MEIVAAVRLLRIEQGGAFADLLIAKGRNSAWNEMEYVERTLGFRTRDLDDRDIRLVTLVFLSCPLVIFVFLRSLYALNLIICVFSKLFLTELSVGIDFDIVS